MDKDKLVKDYQNLKDDYNRLGKNIVEALRTFLKDAKIPFLEIYFRVKKIDSFIEKITRKGYENPFDEIEDICGARIICYYASDIEKVNNIINSEFSVIEQQDKSDLLGLKEFAYRSNHYIVKINESWLSAPNYRKLEGLKSEIQVRTILMHAWAEIEHKLNYKSDAQVPDVFQRKLFRLSAKLEEADEQFEELRIGIDNYKTNLLKEIKMAKGFDLTQEFNLESFKIFIDYKFPNSNWTDHEFSRSFEEFKRFENSFELLNSGIDKYKSDKKQILTDLKANGYDTSKLLDTYAFLWFVVPLLNEEQYERCMKNFDDPWAVTIRQWKNAGNKK